MNLRVAGIVELLQDNCSRDGITQFLCFSNGALHACCTRSEHDLCSISSGQLAALYAHGLRHGKYYLISFYCTYQ